MPSHPLDTGWDFSSVIDLIDSDVHDIGSPTLRPATRPLASVLLAGGVRLGSFAKLYEDLGLPDTALPVLPPLDPESELSNSDDALLLPSPVLEATQAPANKFGSGVDQPLSNTGLSKKQQKKARREQIAKEEAEALSNKQRKKARKEQLKKEEAEQAKARSLCRDLVNNWPNTQAGEHDTPSKPAQPQSPTIPTLVSVESSGVVAIQLKEPKTPKAPRPDLTKRSSIAQSITHRPSQPVQAVQSTESLQVTPSVQPGHTQYTTFGTPASFQLPCTSQYTTQLQSLQVTPSVGNPGLVPRTVRPVTSRRSTQLAAAVQPPTTPTPVGLPSPVYATPISQIAPVVLRSQVDRHFHLFNKLVHIFPDDKKWLVSPKQLVNEQTTSHGLHIFVDASNIMIGFKDQLRYRGVQPYDMSFDSLALLMERRRPVAKRIYAGSHRESNPLPQVTKLVETSRAVGYESNVKEQVLIVREDSEKKKFFNDVKKHGWHKATQLRSGSGSDSETGPPIPKTPSPPKWVEQGVDEILHLKMCQSIIDTEVPSTMVVATGDGAEAEMSDGFLAHVERALRNDWKVELISWRQQTNGGYRRKQFRAKWAEQFRIIELDDFVEDLIDTP